MTLATPTAVAWHAIYLASACRRTFNAVNIRAQPARKGFDATTIPDLGAVLSMDVQALERNAAVFASILNMDISQTYVSSFCTVR